MRQKRTSEKTLALRKKKEERDKKVCSMYQDYAQVGEIAKALGIGRHTVTRILKKHKVYQEERNKVRINKEKIQRNKKIIEMYQSGLSFRKIASIMGLGHTTVEDVIHSFVDIDPIQYSSINIDDKDNLIRHRKHDFDTGFFNKIDIEEKAYWLGFLYADGCITDTAVRLELQLSDIEHVNKFKNAVMAYTKELYFRPDNVDSCLLYLNSVEMVEDLINLGCTPRKTHTLKFPTPEQVPEKLLSHFMRGYFDGDGCIYSRKKRTGVNMFTVVGTVDFIEEYKKVLSINIGKNNDIKCRPASSSEGIEHLELGGNKQIEKIYNFLYEDATVFLERKKEIFKMILGRSETSSQKSLND